MKEGDKVVCVNNTFTSLDSLPLTIGKIYTILKTYDDSITITNDIGIIQWYSNYRVIRFITLDEHRNKSRTWNDS